MASLGSLVVELSANIAKFESSMNRAQHVAEQNTKQISQSVQSMESSFNSAIGTIGNVANALATLAGVTLGFAGIKEAANKFMELNLNAKALSISMGTNMADSAALMDAFEHVGVSTEVVTGMIMRMTRQLKANEDLWNENGIVTRDASGKLLSMTDIMFNSISALKQMEGGTNRMMLATSVFGRSLEGIPGFLRMTREAVDEVKEDLAKLGLTFDDISLAKAQSFQRSMAEMNMVVEALKYRLGDEVIPVFVELARFLMDVGPPAVRAFGDAILGIKDFVGDIEIRMAQFHDFFAMVAQDLGIIWTAQGEAVRLAITGNLTEAAAVVANAYESMKASGESWAAHSRAIANEVRFNIMSAMRATFTDIEQANAAAGLPKTPQLKFTPDLGARQFTRPEGGGGGGGKGGKSPAEAAAERLASLIDTLQKEFAKLSSGSIAEIDAWYTKTVNDINKLVTKGAEGAEALALAEQVATLKKKKAYDDFYTSVLKEAGDVYGSIDEWAKKALRDFPDAQSQALVYWATQRRYYEQNYKDMEKMLSIQKDYFGSVAQTSILLSQQLMWEQRQLEVENQMSKMHLDDFIYNQKLNDEYRTRHGLAALMTPELENQLRAMEGQVEAQRQIALIIKGLGIQGVRGGVTSYLIEAQKAQETALADTTKRALVDMEDTFATGFADSLVASLHGKKADISKIFTDMLDKAVKDFAEMGYRSLFRTVAGSLAGIFGIDTGSFMKPDGSFANPYWVKSVDTFISGVGGITGGSEGGGGGFISDIGSSIGGWLGEWFGFSRGGVFNQGRLFPFASGGIVGRPTIFPMAGGMGLMGERGKEAVLPLTETSGGLGVRAVSAQPNININVINNAGKDVEANPKVNRNTGEIEIYIEKIVNKSLVNGSASKTLSQVYGLSPKAMLR